ncbi:putative lysine decarboxylase [compost metagenome]
MLEQYKGRRKVTVFGSARTPIEHPIYALARELGATLARSDLMVITGAGGGIMAAAHEGAGLDHSLGFNITLPFEQHANATVDGTDKLLPFHFFFTRKLFFVKEADALVLCPGGFGTLDEGLEVLTLIQTGKSPLVPVILLDAPGGSFWQDALDFIRKQLEGNHYILPSDMKLLTLVHSADEAVSQINQFYGNYHSSRWLKKLFVIRMHHSLTEPALAHLDEAFKDLRLSGGFHQHAYNGEEQDEPQFSHLTRLAFTFNARDQGRLRELVDFINLQENWVAAQPQPLTQPARSREPLKVT